MSAETQRVMVIQDASRDVCLSAINWVLRSLTLKPGDILVLLGILHQLNNPMGYKIKVDTSSIFGGVNPIFIAEEVSRRREEYHNNEEIKEISKKCEIEQIEFRIEILVGSRPKTLAVNAARRIQATWVVLDREMKRDKKHLLDKLPCGISKIKRDNTIQELRGPKKKPKSRKDREVNQDNKVWYDEVIPGSPEYDFHQASSSNLCEVKSFYMDPQDEEKETTPIIEAAEGLTQPLQLSDAGMCHSASPNDHKGQQNNYDDWMGDILRDELFKNSICSVCENRRPKIGWKRDFTYAELFAATGGFSDKNFLSEGGFGSVFKGKINGLNIAVKQHKSASVQGDTEFKSEVQVLSKARHENLVMLLGSCTEGNHRLLVYEYVCYGSLDQHLSKHSRRNLSWEKRMKIALGVARGLHHLHENNIIHRDIRPSNILITHDHQALLGDFGLARTHEDSDHSLETRVVGTLGYLAPEYAESGKVSKKTDVYAFGVVLLQLITGLKTTDKKLGGSSLVGWARPLLKERIYPDLIDEKLWESHDIHQLFWMVRVAEKCLSKDSQKRLKMDKVVFALNYLVESHTSSIRDSSPAESDSPNSIHEPAESTVEDYSSFATDSQPVLYPWEPALSSSMSNHGCIKRPPSPPMACNPRLYQYWPFLGPIIWEN